MMNEVPGSCWRHPIWYRKYRIYKAAPLAYHGYDYEYVHDDYEPEDVRCGYARSVEAAQVEIDELED